jgi:two-component system response regulator YesN
MIVEDQPSSAERYASYITDYGRGFVVKSVCRHAAEAFEEFRKCQPEVLFTDIRLPGESGLAMLDRFRGGGWAGQAVIVSGYDDFSYARTAIRLQVAEYLLKPVFPDDMNTILDRLRMRFEDGSADAIETSLIGASARNFPPFVRRALTYVSLNFSHRLSLQDAAKTAFVSAAYLSSEFKRFTGYTFVEYIRRYRIEVAKTLLVTHIPMEEVAAEVGIGDAAYFNKIFKRVEQTTPGKYRRGRIGSTRKVRP